MRKETEHFISYYCEDEAKLAEDFVALLEQKYGNIHDDFGFMMSMQKYEFWMCKDVDEYIQKTGKTKEEYQSWMVGHSDVKNHTITILSPNVVEDQSLEYISKSQYPLVVDISGDFDNFVDNGGYDYAGVYVAHFLKKYGVERFASVYSGKTELSEYIYNGFEKEAIEEFMNEQE